MYITSGETILKNENDITIYTGLEILSAWWHPWVWPDFERDSMRLQNVSERYSEIYDE